MKTGAYILLVLGFLMGLVGGYFLYHGIGTCKGPANCFGQAASGRLGLKFLLVSAVSLVISGIVFYKSRRKITQE